MNRKKIVKNLKAKKSINFHRFHLELITTHTPVPMNNKQASINQYCRCIKMKEYLCMKILSYKLLNLNGESISLDVNKKEKL